MSNQPHDDRTLFLSLSGHTQPAMASSPGDFAVGEVIAGSYKVLSFIGRGGMGAVYRVYHLFLDKELALKTLRGNQITEVAWRRFQIEGQAIGRLDHPNIIRIYDLGIAGHNQPYYVMDVVDGITLSQLIKEEGALEPAFALPIFRQVSAGLAYAHERGIIHRDLKPSNIMLLQSAKANAADMSLPGESTIITAKILDFGLAKLTDLAGGIASGLTKPGEIFGSPLYMSPQQAQGLPIDQSTDMYSFGCTLFEALTGQPPLKGANAIETMLMHQSRVPPRLSEVRPDLEFNNDLERLVARLLAKNPGDRFRTFADIASQLLLLERRQAMGTSSAHNPGGANQTQSARQITGDSTGESTGETTGEFTGEFTNPPSASITTKPWFWPTFLAGSVLFLALLGAGAYMLFVPKTRYPYTNQSLLPAKTKGQAQAVGGNQNPGPGTAIKETADQVKDGTRSATVETSPAANANLYFTGTYFSSVENTPSGRMKVFRFPEKQSLGAIAYEQPEEDRNKLGKDWANNHTPSDRNPYFDGIPARGKQTFPLGSSLGFTPSAQMCNTPILFKQVRADDFQKLDLRKQEFVNSDFLPFIKHLKGLEELILDATDVDDKAIKVLESLPALDYLSINETKISASALARSSLIKRITRLCYGFNNDTSILLNAIKESGNIKELSLDHNPLSGTDLKILASMPGLTKVSIAFCGVGDNELKILTASKSLTNLNIKGPHLTPKSIATLASMKLTKLAVSGFDWKSAQWAHLHAAMGKNCVVTIAAEDYDRPE